MSLADVAIGLKVFLHTDEKDVYSGFMGRYIFLKEKSVFGDGKPRVSFGIVYCFSIKNKTFNYK